MTVLHDPESTGQQTTHRFREIVLDPVIGAWKPLKPEAVACVEMQLVALKIDLNLEVKPGLLRNFERDSLGVEPHCQVRKDSLEGLKQCNGSFAFYLFRSH